MGMRVEEDGESESYAVMAWIGIGILSYAKACRLPSGVSSRENLAIRHKEAKRRTIAMTIDAVSRSEVHWHAINWRKVYQTVRRLQARIMKAVCGEAGSRKRPLRCLSCMKPKFHVRVLRGRRVSNDPLLPGSAIREVFEKVDFSRVRSGWTFNYAVVLGLLYLVAPGSS
jgi:hypothetical protein